LRFGFGAIPDGTVSDSVRLVQHGETLGFDRAWVPDQTFYHDPFVILAACAQATSRIGLMLGVVNPFTRHPVQIARAAGSVDDLAEGRLAVGYGAGNRSELVVRLGYDHSRVMERCREAVLVTRRLLRGEEVDYHSDTLVVDRIRVLEEPRPELRLFLGGRSPGVLRAAGEVADGVIVGSIASAPGLDWALRTVQEGAASAGREGGPTSIVSWVSVTLADDGAEALEAMKPRTARVIAGHRTPAAVLQAVGLPRERIEELRACYSAKGLSATARLITPEEVSLFGLVGTPEQIRERMRTLEQAGVTEFGILLEQPRLEDRHVFLERFASQVIDHLR
jgi:5,10-methylenetetrahydromethanopterin reductase